MTTEESTITINGKVLSKSQATTVRVALESYSYCLVNGGLGDDKHEKAVCKAESINIYEIRGMMYENM